MKLPIPRKEKEAIEFKEKLSPEAHLREERKQQLATQMRYHLESGRGRAVYVIGVGDNGSVKGLSDIEFEETLQVLKVLAAENGAEIAKVEKFTENGKFLGRILITRKSIPIKEHILVGVCGHVSHGKSTLIATLMTGKSDKDHRAWLYLNVLPHEIERGLSADLHYVACGFKAGKPLRYKNPLDKREKARIVREAEKLVSFVDTVGHEPWLRSTIRGIVGQELDYGLLVVAADDGVTHITKEHLGLLLAMDLPVMVCITKTDRVIASKLERVCQQVDELLKSVGKVPYRLRSEEDLNVVIDKLNVVTPILLTSAVTRDGYELLEKLLLALPTRRKEVEKPFILYIDRIYQVPGVGVVVSGTVKQGRLKAGTELLLGPDASGDFKLVRARSIETHYHRLAEANAGLVVGIALKRVRAEELSRGMILCETSLDPRAVWSFDAEVLVLYHPTRIADGYEPVCHISTIAQSVKFELLDKKYLRAGETGRIRMTFKFNPAFVRVGDKLVFREGKTKGIGTVTSIARYA